MAMGEHCYIYVDNNSTVEPWMAERVVQQFEEYSFPYVKHYFGEPTDVDGDPHIYLLLSPILNGGQESQESGLFGFFFQIDQFPPVYEETQFSNYKDIFYLNSYYLLSGTSGNEEDLNSFFSTIAHEFQHMVNFNYKNSIKRDDGGYGELVSFNEGLSGLSEMLVGFGLSGGSQDHLLKTFYFQKDPYLYSLTSWEANKQNLGGGYGISFLFMCYIYDRFGEDVIRKLVQSDKAGIENIEYSTGEDFEVLYQDWLVANWLDGTTVGDSDPRYHYKSIDMKGNFKGEYCGGLKLPGFQAYSFEKEPPLPPWGADYISGDDYGKYTINGTNIGGLYFDF